MKNRSVCIVSVALVSFLSFVHARQEERQTEALLKQTQGVWRGQSATARIEALLAAGHLTVAGQNAQVERETAQAPRNTLEVRIRWDASSAPGQTSPAADPGKSHFMAIERRQIGGKHIRRRSPELSSDQVVVAGVDVEGQLRSWTTVPDPRVIRAEAPGPSGELSGQVLYRSQAEFLVALPDDPAVAELRFYHPRWTGEDFVLELVGSAPMH